MHLPLEIMNLIDTHCHLTFDQLIDDIDEVLSRSKKAGIGQWITVGTDPSQNQKVIQLSERFENLYAAVGIHPHEAKNTTPADLRQLQTLAKNDKVVALGETGLDYHYENSPRQLQKELFTAQVEIAKELGLPLIIHSRDAFEDAMEILLKYKPSLPKVVFHCFTGSPHQAKKIIDSGCLISYTGVVTFKNARSVQESAKVTPIEKMMVETDSPYISPEPMRKQKTNEPALMIHTAEKLASLKEIEFEKFSRITSETARNFFSLPPL